MLPAFVGSGYQLTAPVLLPYCDLLNLDSLQILQTQDCASHMKSTSVIDPHSSTVPYFAPLFYVALIDSQNDMQACSSAEPASNHRASELLSEIRRIIPSFSPEKHKVGGKGSQIGKIQNIKTRSKGQGAPDTRWTTGFRVRTGAGWEGRCGGRLPGIHRGAFLRRLLRSKCKFSLWD